MYIYTKNIRIHTLADAHHKDTNSPWTVMTNRGDHQRSRVWTLCRCPDLNFVAGFAQLQGLSGRDSHHVKADFSTLV